MVSIPCYFINYNYVMWISYLSVNIKFPLLCYNKKLEINEWSGGENMRIEHAAVWTVDIERLKDFYIKYFNGKSGNKYINEKKHFESYFIEFDEGARLEIMAKEEVKSKLSDGAREFIGLAHLAFSVGSVQKVEELTNLLKNEGYEVVSGPRRTGDGYYESCILDPDGNRVEITE